MKKFFKAVKEKRTVIYIVLLIIAEIVILLNISLIDINTKKVVNPQFTDGNLKIIMIDVGNADSFLLLQNDKALLVDAGYFTTYSAIEEVLEENNVKKIDYAIITHPHRDHAGGLFKLVYNYRIDNLYMSNVGKMTITERLFYISMMGVLKYQNMFSNNIVKNNEGFKDFKFGDSYIKFLLLPEGDYEKLNNYSIVFKLIYGNNKILFTGDMEEINEKELLENGVDVSADILKVAHHGSSTSSSEEFLKAVNPKYALVSSGNGNANQFGHPVKRVINFFKEHEVIMYRTDQLSTVELECDGKDIYFCKEPGDYKSGKEYLAAKLENKKYKLANINQ